MNTVTFDTSVWVARHLRSDVNYFEAQNLISLSFKKQKTIIIPEPVLVELVAVLLKSGMHPAQVRKLIKTYSSHQQIEIIQIPFTRLIDTMIKYANRTKLKAGDYQILSYVLEIKPDQFISFDKKLQASYNNYVSSKKI